MASQSRPRPHSTSTPTGAPPRDAADELGRLRALHDAALQIAAPVSAEPSAVAALLARVVDRAAAAVGGRDGLLILADDPAWRDLVPDREGEGLLALRSGGEIYRQPVHPNGATNQVLRSGLSLTVPDTSAPTEPGAQSDLPERGIRALALVPLKSGDRVLGALSVGFGQPGELAEADAEALQLFGAHASAALERVRLMHVERARAEE